ncbi:MAG: alkaline phosphatase family protein, partial [Actinomycetota bacterium]
MTSRLLSRATLALVAVLLLAAECTAGDPGSLAPGSKPAGPDPGNCSGVASLVRRVRRGWYLGRSPQLSFVAHEPHYVGRASMPPHTGPWDFLMDVPVVMYGPGVIARRGRIGARATVADLAPTTAALVRFDGWPTRDGRVLGEALARGAPPPRLVLTIVWDGAGDNLLEAHPKSWPYLRSLMRAGVSFENAIIGSTPSNTPPIHATIGTGAWPRRHGIVSVTQRSDGEDIDPW